MSAPLCVGCGKRPALTHYTDKRGTEVHRALKDHPLCRQCRRSDTDRMRQESLTNVSSVRRGGGRSPVASDTVRANPVQMGMVRLDGLRLKNEATPQRAYSTSPNPFEIPDVYSPSYRPPLRRSDSGENYVTGIRANEKGEVTSLALGVGGSKAGR
jgi:hypothetical protein